MLKVVIVDDEMIVRVGFQSCIPWEEYGCEVRAACESAKEAVDFFRKEAPDILFTDIMMPEMDGIELLEYIRNYHPQMKVVILSCINEIDYVKKALKLGAEDYILKLSFTKETLIETIEKLKKRIEEDKSGVQTSGIGSNMQWLNRENAFRMLIQGVQSRFDRDILLDQLGYSFQPSERYRIASLLIDNFKILKEIKDDIYVMRYGILNIVKEFFVRFPSFELAFIGEDEIMVLFRLRGDGDRMTEFPQMLNRLNETLKIHFNLTLSMGLLQQLCDRSGIPACYQQAKQLAELRFFDGSGSFHQNEEIEEFFFMPKRELQKQIQELIHKQDERKVMVLVDEWFESLKKIRTFGQISKIRRMVLEVWIYLSESVALEEEVYSISQFWDAETLAELKHSFNEAVKAVIAYLRASKSMNNGIAAFLDYLEEHLHETIGLEEAAARCALGRSQFCILFKKATGETFINYFNRLKMKKAFFLLSSENIQVQEAANQIGIRDMSYFSRLFKKYYHMSPSEVRKL